MSGKILIVEDDAALSGMLELHFAEKGHRVAGVGDAASARQRLSREQADLVLLDQCLPDSEGLELLDWLRDRHPDLSVIMMTGHPDLELTIEAMQRGARDFIHKPLQEAELDRVVEQVLNQRRRANRLMAAEPERTPRRGLLGCSRVMLRVSKEIALVAASEARVLITGESGTGKELVARAIHDHSGRRGPFLAVNCAAIVDNLLESELFGHEKGAFTGAGAIHSGKFELAAQGTLFLDEVGELALPLQAKLLRVLQEGSFERVGGRQTLTTTARVLAATNRDLEAEVAAGRFREDLLYRLKVLSIHMPPLRERLEDLPLLLEGLLGRLAGELGRPVPRIARAAMARLQGHDWPGNVRELENVLTQALIHVRDGVLTADLLPLAAGSGERGRGAACLRTRQGQLLSLEALEAAQVQAALSETDGHKGRACAILGISRPALARKMHKYGLTPTH